MEHTNTTINTISYKEFARKARWGVVIILVLAALRTIDYINSRYICGRYVVFGDNISKELQGAIKEKWSIIEKVSYDNTRISSKLYGIFRCFFVHHLSHCFYVYNEQCGLDLHDEQETNQERAILNAIYADDKPYICGRYIRINNTEDNKKIKEKFNEHVSDSMNGDIMLFIINLLMLSTMIHISYKQKESPELINESNASLDNQRHYIQTPSFNNYYVVNTTHLIFMVVFKAFYTSLVNFVIYTSDEDLGKKKRIINWLTICEMWIWGLSLNFLRQNVKVVMDDYPHDSSLLKKITYFFTA